MSSFSKRRVPRGGGICWRTIVELMKWNRTAHIGEFVIAQDEVHVVDVKLLDVGAAYVQHGRSSVYTDDVPRVRCEGDDQAAHAASEVEQVVERDRAEVPFDKA